jgi:hypothetical protein
VQKGAAAIPVQTMASLASPKRNSSCRRSRQFGSPDVGGRLRNVGAHALFYYVPYLLIVALPPLVVPELVENDVAATFRTVNRHALRMKIAFFNCDLVSIQFSQDSLFHENRCNRATVCSTRSIVNN